MDLEADPRADASAPHAGATPAAATRLPVLRARLYVASFLCDLFNYAYPVCISAYARDQLGAEPFVLGCLGTTNTSIYALSCFFLRRLGDRTGSMPLIATSLIVISFLVFPLALFGRSLPAFFAASALFGLSLSFFWPPLLRQLAFLSPGQALWRALGAFNISWALGAAAGSWIGPGVQHQIGEHSGPEAGFNVAVGICLAAALACLPVTAFKAPPVVPAGPGMAAGDEPARGRLFLHLGWIANFCVGFAAGGLHYVMVYVGGSLGFSLGVIGLILFAKELGRTLTFAGLRWWSGWHHSLGWLASVQLAGAAALILAGFVRSAPVFFALFLVFGVFCGLGYFSSVYYSLNLRSDEGAKSGLHEAILAAGVALGPVSCGLMGKAFPAWPGAVPFLPGCVILVGLAVELVLHARSRCAPAAKRATIETENPP
jgi:MFS family permease